MEELSEFAEHPSILIGIAALIALYALAIYGLKRRPSSRQMVAFGAGLVVMLVALAGPIDELEDHRLFTAHMLQHLLLTMIMPPLLLLGLPDWMLRPFLTRPAIRPLARIFTHPIVAFMAFSGIFVGAHEPVIYDWMCRDEAVHIVSHLLFMVTAVMLWWPLLSPLPEFPRLSYPSQIMYVFLLMIPMTAVGAPITLAHGVIYPWYTEGPHPLGISPMADQILGGLLMWVGQGTYGMFIFTAIFYKWSRWEDRDTPYIASSASRPELKMLRSHARIN